MKRAIPKRVRLPISPRSAEEEYQRELLRPYAEGLAAIDRQLRDVGGLSYLNRRAVPRHQPEDRT